MTDKSRERDHPVRDEMGSWQDLRKRVEQKALEMGDQDLASLPVEEARRLLHELRVHQIELEIQNDELRRTHLALDASRTRYFDLYDLAPVGYVTLSERGLILEANLRATTMLGIPRGRLVKQPLTRSIVGEDQDIYYRHRNKLFETGESQVCELRMKQPDGTQLWTRLEAAVGQNEEDQELVCWVTMSDVTEQRALQASLARTERMASMGVLAAGVAHEINNPLTYVLYNIERLAEDLPLLASAVGRCQEALRERVGNLALAEIAGEGARTIDPIGLSDLTNRARKAAVGSQRLKEIAKRLSFFSRVEQIDLSMVDVNQAVEHAIDMASNEIKCRAILVKDLGRVPTILATDGKLAQVLRTTASKYALGLKPATCSPR